jgi:protein-disulfide isomerase
VLWFTGLQLLVLKQICKFCMTVHAGGAVAALIILSKTPFRPVPEKPWQVEKEVYVSTPLTRKLLLGAVVGLAILVAGQVLITPKTYQVRSVAGSALEPVKATNRIFSIYQGRFHFNLADVPLIGPPTAPHAMVSLFDYSCHHCRIMHGHLMEAHRTFGDQLAIVSLPMPLDEKCNYTVKRTPRAHMNACEYARLGLALWRANPTVHEQFDHWMFGPETPPPVEQARAYAYQLGGSNAVVAALKDPWIDKQLQQSMALYATNYYHVGNGSMPQIIIGTNLAAGTLAGVGDLYRILDQQLGLRATTTNSPAPRNSAVTE